MAGDIMTTMGFDESQSTDMVVARAREAAQDRRFSRRLGAAALGAPCDRQVWFGFRWATQVEFPAKVLDLFDLGHWLEDQAVKGLSAAGIHVWEKDPERVKAQRIDDQYMFEFAWGHAVCYLDGVCANVPEAPHKWHTLEVKSANTANYAALIKALEKNRRTQKPSSLGSILGLKFKEFPRYAAQLRIGMYAMQYDRALFVIINKNTSEKRHIRFQQEHKLAQADIARAERIIATDRPPVRIAEQPTAVECKWCDHKMICHGNDFPEVNCRTCTESTPVAGGKWSCRARGLESIDKGTMKAGCNLHMFNPYIIEHWAEPISSGNHTITYRNRLTGVEFTNGAEHYTSSECKAAQDPNIVGDPVVDEIRAAFGAQITG